MRFKYNETIIVFFGVFGQRSYSRYEIVDKEIGAGQIECRWCIGDGKPSRDCTACKNTRKMWISF